MKFNAGASVQWPALSWLGLHAPTKPAGSWLLSSGVVGTVGRGASRICIQCSGAEEFSALLMTRETHHGEVYWTTTVDELMQSFHWRPAYRFCDNPMFKP